jgi:hypothetical protein
MLQKRVNVRTLEILILIFIAFFAFLAIYLFYDAMANNVKNQLIVVVELLLILIIAVFFMCFVLVKIWEQHVVPYYVHKNTHDAIESSLTEVHAKVKGRSK